MLGRYYRRYKTRSGIIVFSHRTGRGMAKTYNTTFVIGAGASLHAGYPAIASMGAQLFDWMRSQTNPVFLISPSVPRHSKGSSGTTSSPSSKESPAQLIGGNLAIRSSRTAFDRRSSKQCANGSRESTGSTHHELMSSLRKRSCVPEIRSSPSITTYRSIHKCVASGNGV